MNDLRAVMWKEWRELIAQNEFGKAATIAIVTALLLIVMLMAAIAGTMLLKLPLIPFICTFVAIGGIVPTVSEAFAGERERHTLETLLASRLTSESLLVGKIVVQVLYSWGGALFLFALFVTGANIRTISQGFVWPSIFATLQVVLITPLLLGVVACAGVLVSLRAPTVRQAQSRLMTGFMVLMIAIVGGMRFIPKEAVRTARDLSTAQMLLIFAVWIAILAAANVVLFLAAWARFQRHKLIEIR